MNRRKLKARFYRWISEYMSDWSMRLEWKATDSDLCPYGARCSICARCGRCTYHGEECYSMSDGELAESRLIEEAKRAA